MTYLVLKVTVLLRVGRLLGDASLFGPADLLEDVLLFGGVGDTIDVTVIVVAAVDLAELMGSVVGGKSYNK